MKIDDISKLNVEEALAAYRDMKIELAPTLKVMKHLEKFIKSEVLSTGELIQVDGAKTAFRKSFTRSSWDNKALRGYAAAHPEILDFVKETEVGPTVSIKLTNGAT